MAAAVVSVIVAVVVFDRPYEDEMNCHVFPKEFVENKLNVSQFFSISEYSEEVRRHDTICFRHKGIFFV